jgi:hypothetical protein
MAIGSRSGGRATARQMSFADLELLRQGVRLDERISKPPPLRNTKTLQYSSSFGPPHCRREAISY